MAAVMMPATSALHDQFSTNDTYDDPSDEAVSENNADFNGPEDLLVQKIRHALKITGYNIPTEHKVANLARNNLLSVYIPNSQLAGQDSSFEEVQELAAKTSAVDAEFWNALDEQRSRFNSNEPVLLVTVDDASQYLRDDVEAFVQRSARTLRTKYGIRPVRVYLMDDKSFRGGSGGSFGLGDCGVGLTLLNVVNTEIGGPSMVQLLDHGHATSVWKDSVLAMEAWRDYEFLWKDESGWNMVRSAEREFEAASAPVSDAVDDAVEPPQSDTEDAPVMLDTVATAPEQSEEDSLATVVEDSLAGVSQHPAVAEMSEQAAAKRDIDHPTWQHAGESESLVDLIRSQSAGLPAGRVESEHEQTEESTIPPTQTGKSRQSDDEFVVL